MSQDRPLWQHRYPKRTTLDDASNIFHPPVSAIRALKSHLLVWLQRALPLWELVRKLIRAGRRTARSLS